LGKIIFPEEDMTDRKKMKPALWAVLIGIFLLALVLRGMAFLRFKDNMSLSGDARNYCLMSHQLADTGIYGYWYDGNPYGGSPGVSNARVMPGYPLFLTLVYKVVGDPWRQITAVRLIQAFLGSLCALLAFAAVRRIFGKDLPAVLTALLVAVYPTYVLSCTLLLTEGLGLFTMLLYFYAAALAFDTGNKHLHLLAGMAFGLHILVRPTLLPLFIVPFIYLLISGRKKSGPIGFRNPGRAIGMYTTGEIGKLFFLQLAGLVVVMAPWWIRNLVTLGSLIITAKGDGNALLAGTYPYWQDYFQDIPESIKGVNDAQREWAIRRIINGLKTEPWLYIKWFTWGKTQHTFGTPYLVNLVPEIKKVHEWLHNQILWFGIGGMLLHSVRQLKGFYLYLYGLIILGLQLLFIPDPRYAYQLMFFLMVGAAFLVDQILELARALLGLNKSGWTR